MHPIYISKKKKKMMNEWVKIITAFKNEWSETSFYIRVLYITEKLQRKQSVRARNKKINK